jgi:hypothetical protein
MNKRTRYPQHVEGEVVEGGASGWKSRQRRFRQSEEERDLGNQARAALIASLQGATATHQGAEPPASAARPSGDQFTQMSDLDLAALYRELAGVEVPARWARTKVENETRKLSLKAEQARARAAEPDEDMTEGDE